MPVNRDDSIGKLRSIKIGMDAKIDRRVMELRKPSSCVLGSCAALDDRLGVTSVLPDLVSAHPTFSSMGSSNKLSLVSYALTLTGACALLDVQNKFSELRIAQSYIESTHN